MHGACEQATNRRIKATELRDVRQQVEGLSSVVDVVREEMAGMKKEGDAPPDPEKDFDLVSCGQFSVIWPFYCCCC